MPASAAIEFSCRLATIPDKHRIQILEAAHATHTLSKQMTMPSANISLICSIVMLSGCASIVNGRSEEISINTRPSEADCVIGGVIYRAPTKASLKRNQDYEVKCTKDGYSPVSTRINSKTSGWVWGNIAFGGLIGLAIDYGTGAAYKLRPNELNLALAPLPGPHVSAGSPANIAAAATRSIVSTISDIDELPMTPAPPNARAHAVIVGIENYRSKIAAVKYAERDAASATEYVKRVFGYQDENVAVLKNTEATKSDFEKYFERWLPNRVEKGDDVIIYFAGHGAAAPDTGKAYLVPYDGDPEYLQQTVYALSDLYLHLAKLPAKNITIILDSCFSGSGDRSIASANLRPIIAVKMADVPANLTLLAATAKNQPSLAYDEVGHGLFTYYLLRAIKQQAQDGPIDIRSAFEAAAPAVSRVARRQYNTDQTPQYLGPKP